MGDWKQGGGYHGYDPSAIPKRFRIREGVYFGGLTDIVANLSDNVRLKAEEVKEGFKAAVARVRMCVCMCVSACLPACLPACLT